MGSATRRKKAFLLKHPFCAFCGGGVRATTIEHCPPRALFQNREWPEGMEFPSCDRCNQGSRDQDALVAMVARLDPFANSGDRDGRLRGLIRKVNSRFPGLFSQMMPSATEARRANRKLGLKPPSGRTHQETGVVKIPSALHDAVKVLAGKLAKGLFYVETTTVFPNDGCLLFGWFTNADVLRDGRPVLFESLKDITGKIPELRRADKDLKQQFAYKLSMSADAKLFVLQAMFGHSFGFAVFGSVQTGQLESIAAELREETGRDALEVLQSGAGLQQLASERPTATHDEDTLNRGLIVIMRRADPVSADEVIILTLLGRGAAEQQMIDGRARHRARVRRSVHHRVPRVLLRRWAAWLLWRHRCATGRPEQR
jgi:hypothetical protein